MSEFVSYKCHNCGSSLSYIPERGKWRCPHCEAEFERRNLQRDPGGMTSRLRATMLKD